MVSTHLDVLEFPTDHAGQGIEDQLHPVSRWTVAVLAEVVTVGCHDTLLYSACRGKIAYFIPSRCGVGRYRLRQAADDPELPKQIEALAVNRAGKRGIQIGQGDAAQVRGQIRVSYGLDEILE